MKWNNVYLLLALPMIFSGAPGAADPGDAMTERKNLIDFSEADSTEWRVINDGVMGGLSQSGVGRTDDETGIFKGMLSLENNGGFASVRAIVGPVDLSSYAGLEIRVRGDGRTYQLRLRTNDRFDGVAYRAYFDTRAGEWTTVVVAFDMFLPTFRGRIIRDAPELNTSAISQLGFMLADKTPGPFSLEIDFVRPVESVTID